MRSYTEAARFASGITSVVFFLMFVLFLFVAPGESYTYGPLYVSVSGLGFYIITTIIQYVWLRNDRYEK
jgi:hypothetical protein